MKPCAHHGWCEPQVVSSGSALPSQLKTSSLLGGGFPAFPGHMTQHILGRELGQRCCEACGQSQAGLWARLLCASAVHMGVSSNPKVTSLVNLIFSLYLGRRGVCNGCDAL